MAARRLLAESKPWAFTAAGVRADKFILSNTNMSVTLTNYGATILSVKAPSRVHPACCAEELTLCYSDLPKLQQSSPFYGSTVGRVANRIAKGSFKVDGKQFTLATNNGENHLHGGLVGWDKVLWTPRLYAEEGTVGVEFTYSSHDGEEGYPGAVAAVADYRYDSTN
jgi:aldose 1-epimerase